MSQKHSNQTSITMQLQKLVWILHARAFQHKKKQGNKENTKIGHNSIIMKPTLQYSCNPHLDPPCTSVLQHIKQDDERN